MDEYGIFNNMDSHWLSGDGPESDIVISSRVRLARNSPEFPFPNRLSLQQEREFLNHVSRLPLQKADNHFEDFHFIDLSLIPTLEKLVLVEKHQISPQLAMSEGAKGLIINQDESLSIMVNEEDHLRIQSISSGLSLDETWALASKADDMIACYMPPAFSPRWGYLTSCPTNTGTGMRASLMVHLPALVLSGQSRKTLGGLGKFGLTYRGLYGEGTESKGNLFQISNQVTLGLSEEDIINHLVSIVMRIIKQERLVRERLMDQERIYVEDRVYRAEAILKSARTLGSEEAFTYLSDLRLGIDLGFFPHYPAKLFNQLLILMQPVVLQKIYQKELSAPERNIKRADMMREKIKGGVEG